MNKSASLQLAIDCLRRDIAGRKLEIDYTDEEREADARRLELLMAGRTEGLYEAPQRYEDLAA